MEVRATLKPGNKGTIKYLRQYGDQLVTVRYRYDKHRMKRLTTVEIIVDEQDWVRDIRFAPNKLVPVQIDYSETELRQQVKQMGGWWHNDKKVWMLKYQRVCELGLEARIHGFDF